MKNNYSNIKVIGFDLDQTLYPKSPKIDEAIQKYIYKKIGEHKGVSQKEAESLFKDLYKEGVGLSGSKSLEALGIPNAKEVVQEALERADIEEFLKPDKEVLKLLRDLKERYDSIDIITGSNKEQTKKKLSALTIPESFFSYIITADDASKSDGSAYSIWMNYYKNLKPQKFLYIGDRVKSDHDIPSQFGMQTILVNIQEEKVDVNVRQLKKLIDIQDLLL